MLIDKKTADTAQHSFFFSRLRWIETVKVTVNNNVHQQGCFFRTCSFIVIVLKIYRRDRTTQQGNCTIAHIYLSVSGSEQTHKK